MPCNCGKNKRTAPTGMGARQPSGQQPAAAPRPVAAMPKQAQPQRRPSAPTRSTGQTQTFALELTSGQTQTYGSRLEAEAARARAGSGIIRQGGATT